MDVPLHDRLDDQVALVTGANRGIGHEIAKQLAALGARVYGTARADDASVPDGVHKLYLDVNDDASVGDAIQRLERDVGRLDILVNNAGIWGESGRFHEQDVAKVDRVIDTNLRGVMHVTHAALPLLLEQDGPRVVNVSSGSGSFDDGLTPRNFGYGISKAALNAFTVSLHGAYGADGLIANSVCPGWVRTDMGGQNASRDVTTGAATPVWLARFRSDAPGGRFWRDQEILPW